ncbi:interferon-related developmental regulator-domain-containing protein [Paraphysoderma sedebokerense]|nr:interferon-related developmental regulator-domain-containing protein [Paraphysoderma sedebokerense]
MSKAAKSILRRKKTPTPSPSASPYHSEDEDGFDDEFSDSSSIISLRSDDTTAEEVVQQLGNTRDILSSVLEGMEEKRTTTREEALGKLIKLLSFKYAFDALSDKQDTILDLLLRSVKKEKSSKENILAAKALSLYFVTMGPENDDKYSQYNSAVRDLIIHFFATVLSNSSTSSQTFNALLKGYTLLLTTISESSIRSEFANAIKIFMKGLNSTNLETRLSSGEGIAVLWEGLGVLSNAVNGDSMDVDNDKSDDNTISELLTTQKKTDLLELLKTLARDSTRYRAKKERSFQRSAFRDILNTVESGISPHLRLRFKHEQVYFESWGMDPCLHKSQIRQLYAFREALGQGLHVHFHENPLLRDIFAIELNTHSHLSKAERKALYHPSSEFSKARTKHLVKERRGKMIRTGAVGTEDE